MQRKIVVTFKRRSRLHAHHRGCLERRSRPHRPRHGGMGPPRVKSHAAAKRRSARRDGAESFAGVEVRAALIATSARATLRRHDSLVEGVWIRTIGPPVTCELCWRGLPLLPARERERFRAISSARRTTPPSRAGARFEQVVACGAAPTDPETVWPPRLAPVGKQAPPALRCV